MIKSLFSLKILIEERQDGSAGQVSRKPDGVSLIPGAHVEMEGGSRSTRDPLTSTSMLCHAHNRDGSTFLKRKGNENLRL